jgi:polar amino acid transport system substrate-binding protein
MRASGRRLIKLPKPGAGTHFFENVAPAKSAMGPAGSTIQTVADADQSGLRIAVARGDMSDLVLTRVLKRAELVRTDSIVAAIDLLRTGGANAMALNRPSLIAESARLPGSRVLGDGFGEIYSAMAVPKGHAGRLAYINEFIEDAKASGLVNHIIKHWLCNGCGSLRPEACPSEKMTGRD